MTKKVHIQADNIHKAYGRGDSYFEALKGVSLTVYQGDRVAIVGKSGSGKSTLMHILSALDTPTNGDVLFHNHNIARFSNKQRDRLRSRAFGFIFQQFFLVPQYSVLENVTLPLKIQGIPKSIREKKALAILAKLGMEDKARQKAVFLSGGQKQRTAIARALISEPQVIFADEPTGNLDTNTGKQIIDTLLQLNETEHITLLIVTHDRDLAKQCQRTITIQDGQII